MDAYKKKYYEAIFFKILRVAHPEILTTQRIFHEMYSYLSE
jgi:hypothetical protein